MPEVPFELFIGIGRDTQGPHLNHFRIEKGFRIRFDILHHGVDQILRLTAGSPDKDAVAPVNIAENIIFAGKLFRVFLFQRFKLTIISRQPHHRPPVIP